MNYFKVWVKEFSTSLIGLRWGFDKDGDFGLRILGWNFIFYKWSNPVITKDDGSFVPLMDTNSKPVWRKFQKPELVRIPYHYQYLEKHRQF